MVSDNGPFVLAARFRHSYYRDVMIENPNKEIIYMIYTTIPNI